MNKHPHEPGHNVLQMPAMPLENRSPARDFPGDVAAAGSPDDPRMREAMRLIEAFLAIEDAAARRADRAGRASGHPRLGAPGAAALSGGR